MNVYEMKEQIDEYQTKISEYKELIRELEQQMQQDCSHPKEVVSTQHMNDQDDDEPGKQAFRWLQCECKLCGHEWKENETEIRRFR